MQRDHIRRLTIGAAFALFIFLPGPVTLAAPPASSPSSSDEMPAVVERSARAIADGRYDEAVAALTAAIDGGALTGTRLAVAYHHRALALQKTGVSDAAIADYTKAIEIGLPPAMRARAHYNRALAEAAAGNTIDAERDYTSAIELVPDYAPAWNNRANLERERQDYPTAIRDYGEAIVRLGDSPKRKLPLLGRALAYEKTGDLSSAVADLRQAVAIDPQFDMAQARLAELEPMLARSAADDAVTTGSIAPAEQAGASGRVVDVVSGNGWNTTAVRYGAPAREEPAPKPALQASIEPAAPVLQPSVAAEEGRFRIQLGAFRGPEEAARAWDKFRTRDRTLAALDHRVEAVDLGAKGTYYRLQAGAFKTRAEARSLCAKLKANRLDCMVAGG